MAQRSRLEAQLEQARAAQLADVAAQLEQQSLKSTPKPLARPISWPQVEAELDAQRELAASQHSRRRLSDGAQSTNDAEARLASGRAQYAAGQQSYEQGRASTKAAWPSSEAGNRA